MNVRLQIAAFGFTLAAMCGFVVHARHLATRRTEGMSPAGLILDILIGAPIAVLVAMGAAFLVRRVIRVTSASPSGILAHATFATTVGVGYALGTVPAGVVSEHLFGDALSIGHSHAVASGAPAFPEASSLMLPAAIVVVAITLLVGLPWQWRSIDWRVEPRPAPHRGRGAWIQILGAAALASGLTVVLPGALADAEPEAPAPVLPADEFSCGMWPGTRTIVADVVALDQEIVYNRLGAVNPTGMMYALRDDVVDKTTALSETEGATLTPGNVMLRPDKRPRPLTLRVNSGDCLEINFENLLSPVALSNQPADRNVGIHVNGLQVVGDIGSDGSFVGTNPSSLVAPGQSTTYTLFAEYENTYLMYNMGSTIGGEGGGGTISEGLFGAVNVEPFGTEWFRSQLTRVDMDLAASAWIDNLDGTFTAVDEPQVDAGTGDLAIRLTADGHPVMNYGARYPTTASTPGYDPAKAGAPIVNMLDGTTIVHSDLNGVISGPAENGYQIPLQSYPESYWLNEIYNQGENQGAEPFREFTVIFHDEIRLLQTFPEFFDDPTLSATLHGVRDAFGINYGTGGIGAEIIANRIGVGPMRDCVECKYEEFFLSAWTVGDPAMIVDIPANADAFGVPTNQGGGPVAPGAKATKALYPDDPSNVHHSYLSDRIKFRNLHAGPKEHHIFHLHAQQWQYDWNTEKSGYLDSQNIGPGGGFTYEIAYGGSGNRNFTTGDMIFHCHFYPHFAQGMWELWRVHDTFERGTELTAVDPLATNPVDATGTPVSGSRALPDGEIAAGTPTPAVVPLPSRPMAPVPAPVSVAADGASAQIDIDNNGIPDFRQIDPVTGTAFATAIPAANPGYPYWIPGVAGHRPPTPPMDLAIGPDGTPIDGGLQRHIITGGEAVSYETRLDFNKELVTATLGYISEGGTPAEQAAMQFHGGANPASYRPDGTSASFQLNGLPPQQGSPYADPCRQDGPTGVPINPGGATDRTYKAAVIELGVQLNKEGWHFQQQRILTLNDDVEPTLSGARAPEPLVMRINAGECVRFEHTNLVPNVYELDDFQVRTPTDVIGQHIHLVKFDVTSSDGSANGFNYEDGTFSPEEVEERIHAVRHATDLQHDNPTAPPSTPSYCQQQNGTDGRLDAGEVATLECPLAELHPEFGGVAELGHLAWGARTTVQRWYADPLLNNSWDGGVGTVFTHDHFGPSTHQQVGLYATVLIEAKGTEWLHNETGERLGDRADGGPTTWQAQIVDLDGGTEPGFEPHREFFFEYSDFQHAYEPGGGALGETANGAVDATGAPVMIPTYDDFANAVNPSVRLEPPSGHEADLVWFPPTCPGGHPRPCPEAISAEDPGTYVVNYRNEPIGARVYDPTTGTQASGDAGDLAFAYASIDRANPLLNTQPAVYPPLTADVGPTDPFTPMMRAYMGDKVRVRIQVGGQEEEHTFSLPGMEWRQEALSPNSGWRSSGSSGISEYFILETPVVPDIGAGTPAKVDYMYRMGTATDDIWNGVWGLFRTYGRSRRDLAPLQNSPMGQVKGNNKGLEITNLADFDQDCPAGAPVREYKVAAVRAGDVLGPNGLVYNDRATAQGPLHDPEALMYVMYDDLVFNETGQPIGLVAGTPLDPLVLRAASGDCIQTDLVNLLPETIDDQNGYNLLPPIIKKNKNVNGGIVTFNNNDINASSVVGFVPQLVHANVRTDLGYWVGGNSHAPVRPGTSKRYRWYAGDIGFVDQGGGKVALVSRPIEFGTSNLMPADSIKGASKGLVATLVVEPPGATWVTDPGSNVSATVSFPDGVDTVEFREFVTVIQNDVNLRWGSGCLPTAANLQCAVPNLSEADDAQDSGAKAINYGTEPMWYRLGMDPATDFSVMRDTPDAHRVYSNGLVGGDPQTAVFTVSPYKEQFIRMRVSMPGGHARGIELTTHGHPWQRQPYIQGSDRMSWSFHDDPTNMLGGGGDGVMGNHNMVGWWISSQESISASSHHDLQFRAGGGRDRVQGDFLFRDFASFGNMSGLWGIIRHAASDAMARADRYAALHGAPLSVADPAAGLLANDLDLDGHAFAVVDLVASGATTVNPDGALTAATDNGIVTVQPDGTFEWQPNPGFTGVDTFQYVITGGASAVVSIAAGNSAPTADDGAAETHGGLAPDPAVPGDLGIPGAPVTIDVLGAGGGTPLASDADGDVLVVSTSHPDAVVELDGSITYVPPAELVTPVDVVIPYTVEDGFGGSASAVITVAVTLNEAPTAPDMSATTQVDVPIVIPIVGDCSDPLLACDPDGDPLVVSSPDAVSNGDGTISYTPPPGVNTVDLPDIVITYAVNDGYGGSATGSISIAITVNQPPVATDGNVSTTMDTPIGIAIVGPCDAFGAPAEGFLACDPDVESLTVSVTHPDVALAPDGSITYVPPAGFSGQALIDYEVIDGSGATDAGVIAVDVVDTVEITRAWFRRRQSAWSVRGSVFPAAAGVEVTVEHDGVVIGIALTDDSGSWSISAGPATADCTADVTATSSRGGATSVAVECRQ